MTCEGVYLNKTELYIFQYLSHVAQLRILIVKNKYENIRKPFMINYGCTLTHRRESDIP